MIVTKKDGIPRFCVDYRFINRLMKGDRWLIQKVKEIFDYLIGAWFFTTLDLLNGYLHIKLYDGCREKRTSSADLVRSYSRSCSSG